MNRENAEYKWKGAGFGDYECTNCWEITAGTPAICPHCKAVMSNPERYAIDFPDVSFPDIEE